MGFVTKPMCLHRAGTEPSVQADRTCTNAHVPTGLHARAFAEETCLAVFFQWTSRARGGPVGPLPEHATCLSGICPPAAGMWRVAPESSVKFAFRARCVGKVRRRGKK